jgi:hypothetical protein
MNLTARPLTHEDYDNILKGWWKDWGWEAPSRDFLPQDGAGGILVSDGEVPVCAGFLYNTNSKVALVEFIISNKEYRLKPNRGESIKKLIDSLISVAKNINKKYIFANNNNPSLVNHFIDKGFNVGAKNQTELVINI